MNIKGINTYFYWIRLYPYRCNGPLGDSVKKNRTTTNSYWGKGVRSMDGLNIVKNYFCLGKFFVSVMWILYCFWGSTFLFGVLSYYFWYTMMPWLGISYRVFRENLSNFLYPPSNFPVELVFLVGSWWTPISIFLSVFCFRFSWIILECPFSSDFRIDCKL